MSDKVAEIDNAAQAQAQGIAEINIAITDLDNLTQQNAAMVEETTAAAEELKSDVSELRSGAFVFKTGAGYEVEMFQKAS